MSLSNEKKTTMYLLTRKFVICSAVLGWLVSGCSGAGEDPGGAELDNGANVHTTSQAVDGLHPLGANPDSDDLVNSRLLVSAPPVGALPASVDLSAKLPPVGDQGGEGSCVGFAIGYALKTYQEKVEDSWSVNSARYQFSPSWIYNQINGGTDGGSSPSDAFNLLVNKGADTLAFFPYSDGSFTTQPAADSFARAARFKASSWGTLTVDAATFKQSLTNGKPVVITFGVFPDWDSLNASNPVYDSSSGKSRGSHAVTIVGYDDTQSAFHVINSWGTGWGISGYGWIGYDFITDKNLNLKAYTLADAPNAGPPTANSLYLVQDGRLWRADNDLGDYLPVDGTDWAGATSATTLGGSVYIIQANSLQRVNPATGAFTQIGGFDWTGPTNMAGIGNKIYITQDGALWSVDNLSTGAYHKVGGGVWTGASSMTALGGSLYIVQDSFLWKVSPSTGAFNKLGGADWSGPTTLTGIGSQLYITQDSSLWSVDNLSTGAYHQLGTGIWTGASSMTNLNGALDIVQDGNLWTVDPTTGNFEMLGAPGSWTGSTVMTAVP